MIVGQNGSGARAFAEDAEGIVGWSPDGESIGYTVAVPDEAGPDRQVLHVVSIGNGADRVLPVPPNASDFQWTAAAAVTGEPSSPSPVAASSPTDSIGEPGAGAPLQPDASWGGIAFRTAAQEDFDCFVGVLRFPFDSSVVSPGARPTVPGGSAGNGATAAPQKAASCDLPFAPDGSAFIRADQLSSTWEIVRFDGSVVAGPSPYTPAPPAWSTGGDWVVMPACDADDCSHAIIERPDGSGRRVLPGQPLWSARDEFLSVQGPDGSLLVGNGDGTDLHPIGSFPQPSGWSPDGSSFVFVRDGDAWIAGADGTRTRNLTAFPLGGATQAAWSPDGRWILVLQGSTVWAVTPDGSSKHRLGADLGPPNSDHPWAPSWSPDRASVALGAGEDTVLFSTDGWHGVRVEHARQPVWSPDGRFVAVVSDVGGAYTVDVMRPDGSGRTTVSAAISYPPVIWLP
jgi:hypothetical protein